MSIPTFVALYNSMVRSHLDYCCPVWSPYRKGDIEALEKVQRRASKLIPVLKNLPYNDCLKACNTSTLHYRRVRGDMIETFKILHGKYDTNVVGPYHIWKQLASKQPGAVTTKGTGPQDRTRPQGWSRRGRDSTHRGPCGTSPPPNPATLCDRSVQRSKS